MSAFQQETLPGSSDHLAAPTVGAQQAEPQTYVTFELADQIFAVCVENVREILDLQSVSPLPNAPQDVLGMIDVRGEGIAVLELSGHLGMTGQKKLTDQRILLFELPHVQSSPIGVVADRVLNVVAIADTEIESVPEVMDRWKTDVMTGVMRIDGQIVMVLSLDSIFAAQDAGAFDFG